MPWNLLLLPLLGGYYLLSRFNRYKYIQQRLDKQRLIFDSILFGLLILAVTILIRIIFEYCCSSLVKSIYDLFPIKIPYIGTTVLSFILAIFFTEIGNKTFCKDHRKQIDIAIKKVGNELEMILRSSFNNSKLLEFTLDTNKFYIGWVKELPIPTLTNNIRIIPVFSGFRNQQRKLIFTTHYLSIYSEYIKEGKVKGIEELDVDLIISTKNIVTVSYFDIEMYERFNKLETDE